MLSSFHTVRDIALAVTLLGRLGLLLNQRHLLLSVLCIERRLYGVNLFLVALSILLDDRSGLLFALFVLTLAAAESALALALLRSYFQVHGSILLRAELFTLQPMPVIYKSNKLVTLQRLVNSKFHGTVFSCFSYETSNVKLSLSQARSYSSSVFGPSSSAFLARLTRLAPSALDRVTKGERRVKTTPTNLLPLLTLLKEHTGREFTQLRDITAVDRPERKRRFEVVYSLLSIRYRQRLRVSVTINELDRLPSVTSLFPSAG
jgi:NADH:ubiquinone oxidoreductase subunit K